MAEDNPWKKQMINRAPIQNTTPQNVAASVDSSQQPVNPWKAKMNNATVVPTSSTPSITAPSWKKPDTSTSNITQNNPWKKAQQTNTGVTTSLQNNPWKKNNIANTSPALGNTYVYGSNGGSGGSSFGGVGQNNNIINNNINKFGGNKIQTIKDRKQRQDKERLDQEKLEKERVQKERKEEQQRVRAVEEAKKVEELRLKEEADMERERKAMELEDKWSTERQRQDKIVLAKEQQTRQGKRGNKKQGTKPSASSPRKTVLLQKPKLMTTNLMPQEQWECTGNMFILKSISEKLERQKDMLRIVFDQFKKQCQKQIIHNITSPDRSIAYIKEQGSGVTKYAYALMSSSLNSDNTRTVFDDSDIKRLKNTFKFYDKLNDAVTQISRKVQYFKFRVPLMALAQYKGVFCLAQAITSQQSNTQFMDLNKVSGIQQDILLLEKEMRKTCVNFTVEMIQCKKIILPPDSSLDHVYLLYVKKPLIKLHASKLGIRREHLQSIDWIYEIKCFKTSVRSINQLLETEGSESRYLQDVADCLKLAKAVRKVYRSGQAQLEQSNFWKLAFTNNDELWDIVHDAGYPHRKFKNMGILVKVIQYFCGVQFEKVDGTLFEAGPSLKTNHLKWTVYDFSNLQLIEFTNNYHKYLKQGKLELATEAVVMRYQLVQIQETLPLKVNLVLDHAQLMLFKGNFADSLLQVAKVETEVLPFEFQRIRMYSILVKNHCSIGDQQNLLKAFQTLFSELNFYYGLESPLHVTLYSVLGYFYSSRKFRQSIDFYQLALGVALNVYHPKHQVIADIYMDLAQAYITNSRTDQAEYNIDNASKVYDAAGSPDRGSGQRLKAAQLDVLRAKVILVKNKTPSGTQSALHLLDKAMKLYLKFERPDQLVDLYILRLGLEKDPAERQLIIDAIFALAQTYHKNSLLKKSYELAFRELIPKMTRSKIQKMGQIMSSLDQQGESKIGSGVGQHLCQAVRRGASMLQSGTLQQEKGQALLADILRYFSQEEWSKIASIPAQKHIMI